MVVPVFIDQRVAPGDEPAIALQAGMKPIVLYFILCKQLRALNTR